MRLVERAPTPALPRKRERGHSAFVVSVCVNCISASRLLAMRAGAGDLDDRELRDETRGARRRSQALRDGRGRNLADRAAMVADQERDHRGLVMVVRAGEEGRSEEHTSELQSPCNLVCRLLLE